ncbi:AraC family transcriptional regulator [Bordetella sp. LUAb4]|uniref:AraC family transcriptional regulator n=1 Tax=Bordetella sp. LUAb4 TaxID=2843195 RepID=UPI001E2F019D|nr:AraC family transcriptional regulator [Bordetella sp. LUAb4]
MLDRSEIPGDPLSDLIRLAAARPTYSGEMRGGGSWAIRMPRPEGLKFFAILRGRVWLQLRRDEPAVELHAGDVAIMYLQHDFLLASDLAAPERDAHEIYVPPKPRHSSVTLGDGSEFHMLGGHALLDAECGQLLAAALPPLIHVSQDCSEARMLRWLVERLIEERATCASGHALMTQQLTQMLFLQTLRLHLSRASSVLPGWLRAMTDERLQPALRCIHDEPGRPWQLEELARACAMSRTTFAVRFKAVSGVSPMAYLTNWRMQLARHALKNDPRPFSSWMEDLGYASESAFSHAFKRTTGLSPAQYRRGDVRDGLHDELTGDLQNGLQETEL